MTDVKKDTNETEEILVESKTELDLLKEKAFDMGIPHHPSIGLEKLQDKVDAAIKEATTPKKPKPAPMPTKSVAQLKAEHNSALRRNARKLVRVRITCMNPNKKDWQGQFFDVGNSIIGTIKKFVPYNTESDEGYHVPQVILDDMKNRKFQHFKRTMVNGRPVMKGSLMKEFAIEILDPLSPKEIKELGHRQALNHSID